jgi:hypothetical protein
MRFTFSCSTVFDENARQEYLLCKTVLNSIGIRLFDKRPDNPADDCISETDEPGLRPVQVGMGRLFAKEAEGMKGVVGGPLVLERVLDRFHTRLSGCISRMAANSRSNSSLLIAKEDLIWMLFADTS